MKMRMQISAMMLMTVISMVAAVSMAASYRFKFKATSSGEDMYACNAGIMSQKVTKQLCYKENSNGTRTEVSVDESCSTTNKNCNSRVKCVSLDGGVLYQNKLIATSVPWNDHSEQLSNSKINWTKTSSVGQFSSIFSEDKAFDNKIFDVLFDLNTEMYNGKYFVDICFRGSQNSNNLNGFFDNYLVSMNVGSTDFTSVGETHGDNDRTGIVMSSYDEQRRYTQLSGLKVQSFVVCDTQGSGALQNGTNAAGVYNTSQNEAYFSFGSDKVTPNGSASGGFYLQSDLEPIPGVGKDLKSGYAVNPRFCKVRYIFTETNALSANPLFRDWTRKGAEMCTYTVISDPKVQPVTTSN